MNLDSKSFRISITGLSIIFCVLWITAASGELWCDEIWSLKLLEKIHSPLDIFQLKHDNNHILNSIFLFIYQRMNFSKPLLFRLHSISASAGTFILLAVITKKYIGKTGAIVSCALYCLSYFSMLIMTEARGYGMMIFAVTLSLFCFLEYKSSQKNIWSIAFAASGILAVLSHTSALFFMAMLAFSDIINSFLEEKKLGERLSKIIVLHGPGCFLGCIWTLYFFSGIRLGYRVSAEDLSLINSFLLMISSVFGTLSFSKAGLILGGILYFLFIFSLAFALFSVGKKDILITIILIICTVFPSLVLFILKPPFVFPRYFSIIVPCIFLGFGVLAERIQGKYKWLVIAICVFIAAGNIPNIYKLERIGRGEYGAALEKILAHDSSAAIRIGTDANFMGEIVLENAVANSSGPERFHLIKQQDDTSELSFINSLDYIVQVVTKEVEDNPPAEESDGSGTVWKLIYSGKNPPFSGWNFFIYQKQSNKPVMSGSASL